MNCEICGTRLINLYYQNTKKGNRKLIRIKALYCRKCEKPTEVVKLNWFNGE